ncbi:MAG: TIGR04168 family protein [Hormoscilla sp. GM7CHS1pb]|nr:TIGR04168 family protein [Hormoscilla sp. GM7CHS1pb]
MTNYADRSILIAVVGDIHDQWETDDAAALKHLGADLALFVGDFGNESVPVVNAIASLEIPFAAIAGNHDCWWTATPWGEKKCPYNRQTEDRVQQQLDLLGAAHVGYGKLDLASLNLTVVGGRPFSWGGSDWTNAEFYRDLYGINNFAESTSRIVTAASSAAYETIIFMGHCGPKGLGDKAEDPCGRDWKPLGEDRGDPDLQEAICLTRAAGKRIPLVVFGHMHHNLRHTKTRLRKSIVVSPEGTVYLNAARVPRIIETGRGRLRNFSLVSLSDGVISRAELVWVDEEFNIAKSENLYKEPNLVVPSV